MGLLDNAGNLLNRGVANAGRGTKAISLKAQIAELNRSRTSLMAQLGESLYEPTKALEEYRAPREALYASLEELDAQRFALQSELDSIERQASLASAPAPSIRCPKCGRGLSQSDVFCPGCGTNVEQARASMRLCTSCGSVLGPEDVFCMNCGTPVSSQPTPPAVVEHAPVAESQVGQPNQRASGLDEEPLVAQGPTAGEHATRPFSSSEALEVLGELACDEELTEEIAPVAPMEATAPIASAPITMPVAPVEAPAPVQIPDNIKVCPACGYHANVTAAFCRNCGNRL